MKNARFVLLGVTVAVGTAAALAAGRGPHAIPWHTIDGGGGTSSAGAIACSGTIGQPDAGAMTGGGFALVGGFWVADAGGPPPCPADIDGDRDVDFDDLLRILAVWGPCQDCPEDLDHSGAVDFNDLLAVLSTWGDCPE